MNVETRHVMTMRPPNKLNSPHQMSIAASRATFLSFDGCLDAEEGIPPPHQTSAVNAAGNGAVSPYARRFAIALACIISFGPHFLKHAVGPLKPFFVQQGPGAPGWSSTQFGLLLSSYSWPNVVLPIIFGVLFDAHGHRAGAIFVTGMYTSLACERRRPSHTFYLLFFLFQMQMLWTLTFLPCVVDAQGFLCSGTSASPRGVH